MGVSKLELWFLCPHFMGTSKVCECERETEREKEGVCVSVSVSVRAVKYIFSVYR